jgi:hypothetical protein
LGEQLFELIDYQQQPMRHPDPAACPSGVDTGTLGEGGLPRGEGEPGRVGL